MFQKSFARGICQWGMVSHSIIIQKSIATMTWRVILPTVWYSGSQTVFVKRQNSSLPSFISMCSFSLFAKCKQSLLAYSVNMVCHVTWKLAETTGSNIRLLWVNSNVCFLWLEKQLLGFTNNTENRKNIQYTSTYEVTDCTTIFLYALKKINK